MSLVMEGALYFLISFLYALVGIAYYLTWRKLFPKTYLHLLGYIIFAGVCLPLSVICLTVRLLNKPLPKRWG